MVFWALPESMVRNSNLVAIKPCVEVTDNLWHSSEHVKSDSLTECHKLQQPPGLPTWHIRPITSPTHS